MDVYLPREKLRREVSSEFIVMNGLLIIRCSQVGLKLDYETTEQSLRLFRASKNLLKANIGTIGTGTVSVLGQFPWF